MNGYVDLLVETVGGEALLCSDDFFASMHNLVKAKPAEFDPTAYTDRGKLMDGWESRRKRVPGHDWCMLRLGVPGRIVGVDFDTSYFLGNHPPFASLDAVNAPGATAEALRDQVEWTRIVPVVPLERGSSNLAAAVVEGEWTHLRLNMYPAGGIARLRVFGLPTQPWSRERMDLASVLNGGRAVACSDMFFSPMQNLVAPGEPENMGGGWETRRSRPPGEDWILVALGTRGRLQDIELSTRHFKGNPPDRIAIDAVDWPDASPHALTRWGPWHGIVPMSPVKPDSQHAFAVSDPGPWTHLRLRIVPDGGVARLRAFGIPAGEVREDPLLERINGEEGEALLRQSCGSARWVAAMLRARPFSSRDHLFGQAEDLWWHLGDGDWLEAFTHHPMIGGDVDALRQTYSAQEQSGLERASEATLQRLAEGNRAYEARYGFIFIVCASGKSAEEMATLLEMRMNNEAAAELRIAAGEQAKITRLRLERA